MLVIGHRSATACVYYRLEIVVGNKLSHRKVNKTENYFDNR